MNVFENNLLKYLSKPQLKKIQRIKIGLGGAGGLGSNIAIILVRSGFKHFEIIDFDKIEFSNLNRQQYFLNEVGKNKVETLKKRLLAINPSAKIKTYRKRWNKSDAHQYFKACDFIVEAFDNASFKRDFVENYQSKAKFIISGNGLAGFGKNASLRVKKIRNIYLIGDNITGVDKNNPPLAPRVTMCAAMMAQCVLNLTLKTSII